MSTAPSMTFVTVDCADPEALAGFWSELLETGIAGRYGENYVILEPQEGRHVRLAFQRVPEAKAVKNRVHVDLIVPNLEAGLKRVLDLGGRLLAEHTEDEGYRWMVMADPEGNEFCIAVSG